MENEIYSILKCKQCQKEDTKGHHILKIELNEQKAHRVTTLRAFVLHIIIILQRTSSSYTH